MRAALAMVAAALVLVTSAPLYAHKGAHGVVHERMEMMKAISTAMKAIERTLSGRRRYDADKVKRAAARIEAHAGHILGLFPEGSLDTPTKALPAIWQRWPDFKSEAARMREHAAALAAAADRRDPRQQMQAAFKALAATCSACHRSFKARR